MIEQQLEKSALVTTRPATPGDVSFIFSTWLKGLKFGNSWYRLIDDKTYYHVYHQVVESILSNPATQVKIACLQDAPDVILGYSVYIGDKLHWVHVKKAWRKIGIAKDLVPGNITTVSHLTDVGKIIFLKKKLTFNPF